MLSNKIEKKQSIPIVILALLLFWSDSAPALAEEIRYVTDTFTITMRRGNDATYQIIQMLKTGTPMTILERGDNGWNRIRTRGGSEGWVLDRFMVKEKPARDRLKEALDARAEAEQKALAQQDEMIDLKAAAARLQASEAALARLRKLSSDTVSMERNNHHLKATVEKLEQQMVEKNSELERLNSTYMAIGTALFIFIIGLGFGRWFSHGRRRSQYRGGLISS